MPEVIRSMTFTRKALFAPTGLMICAAGDAAGGGTFELVDECTSSIRRTGRGADVDLPSGSRP